MIQLLRILALSVLLLGVTSPDASAAGGSSKPKTPDVPARSPLEEAIDHYNDGIMLRDNAWRLEKKASSTPDEAKQMKLNRKANGQFERAAKEFRRATEKNPEFHEAFSDLGYSLRRTGDYSAAIEAYDRALTLAPDYAEAIEYRAEAYLGLNRLDEAKQAYIDLLGRDRPKADVFLAAMRTWVGKREQDPGDLDADTFRGFADWVTQQEQLVRESARLSTREPGGW